MKLDEIIETIVANINKYGKSLPVFKNPSPDELKEIMHHGVVKCIISNKNVYAFDWNNVSYDELPKINGIRANLFFKGSNSIDIEVSSFDTKIKEEDVEKAVKENTFLQQFKVGKIHMPKEEDFI